MAFNRDKIARRNKEPEHDRSADLRSASADHALTPVVFITGGTSGIGLCSARLFAKRGFAVGLIARGEAALAAAAEDMRAVGARTATASADVADGPALDGAARAIVAVLGVPDIWINCAGNGVYGRFGIVTPEEFDRVTAVTYGGTVHGCRTALALMAGTGRGTIVNVCSGAAIHGLPLMTSYAGAKAAVRGFAQALRAELRIERSRIRVSTVFPPAVNTPFFSHAVSHMAWPARPVPPVYQPEVVAEAIWRAAERGQAEVLVSGTTVAFSMANRVSPALIAFCMSRLGFEGQLTRDPDAGRLQAPTLFAPSSQPSGVHGPFGGRARGWSVQGWASRHSPVHHLGAAGAQAWRRIRGRTAPPSPATRAPPGPHPAPEG